MTGSCLVLTTPDGERTMNTCLSVSSKFSTKNINFSFNGNEISGYNYLYRSLFQPLAGNINGSLLFALSHVLVWWLILYWLYRKKIFFKL